MAIAPADVLVPDADVLVPDAELNFVLVDVDASRVLENVAHQVARNLALRNADVDASRALRNADVDASRALRNADAEDASRLSEEDINLEPLLVEAPIPSFKCKDLTEQLVLDVDLENAAASNLVNSKN